CRQVKAVVCGYFGDLGRVPGHLERRTRDPILVAGYVPAPRAPAYERAIRGANGVLSRAFIGWSLTPTDATHPPRTLSTAREGAVPCCNSSMPRPATSACGSQGRERLLSWIRTGPRPASLPVTR